MKSTLSNIIIFAAGAAIGSVVTWRILRERYEQYVKEEIESVKEVYSRKKQELDEETADENEGEVRTPHEKPDISEYKDVLKQCGYRDYSTTPQFKDVITDEEMSEMKRPYVITPQEFNDGEYAIQSLTYYADGILVDDDGEPIENIDALVGLDSLNHFGEYEEDSVFVRNDVLAIDFEILADVRNYFDTYPE